MATIRITCGIRSYSCRAQLSRPDTRPGRLPFAPGREQKGGPQQVPNDALMPRVLAGLDAIHRVALGINPAPIGNESGEPPPPSFPASGLSDDGLLAATLHLLGSLVA